MAFKIDRYIQLIIQWINLVNKTKQSRTIDMFAARVQGRGGGSSKLDDEDSKWEVTLAYTDINHSKIDIVADLKMQSKK